MASGGLKVLLERISKRLNRSTVVSCVEDHRRFIANLFDTCWKSGCCEALTDVIVSNVPALAAKFDSGGNRNCCVRGLMFTQKRQPSVVEFKFNAPGMERKVHEAVRLGIECCLIAELELATQFEEATAMFTSCLNNHVTWTAGRNSADDGDSMLDNASLFTCDRYQ